MNDPEPKTIEKGKYLHAKSGKFYEVIGTALQTETKEQLVVYRPLYDSSEYEIFARPYAMFIEKIVLNDREVQRFERVAK